MKLHKFLYYEYYFVLNIVYVINSNKRDAVIASVTLNNGIHINQYRIMTKAIMFCSRRKITGRQEKKKPKKD